jgi:hypothetical protein
MDAGPHVKVLSSRADAPAVVRALEATDAVVRVIATRPGRGAHVEEP